MNRSLVFDLATGAFIDRREDAMLLGPGGTGKSHLAQAIGQAAMSPAWAQKVRLATTLGDIVLELDYANAPLTVTNGVILRPEKRATVFDALPNATMEQCRQLGKDKLREAIEVVVSSLVKT